jgi:uncharacterized RDD family membrane protein YckC
MKCPKCGYLGFEHVPRCRNCGYDFSLTAAPAAPDLPIRSDAASPESSDELPLFGAPIPDDDRPLITKPSPPRAPLSVRRATPEIPRVRAEQLRTPSFDLDLDAPALGALPDAHVMPDPRAGSLASEAPHQEDATVGARLLAVAIDMVILAVVDAMVIYLTMQICGITLDEIDILPKGPLLAFFLVQNGGYLVAFTAGGQTLGKMAAGIRVVSSDEDEALDLGRALLRTLMWIVLAVPAGLGFLTAVLSRDHRGLHDRFAGTRVVR